MINNGINATINDERAPLLVPENLDLLLNENDIKKEREPISISNSDKVFALVSIILGTLFIKFVLAFSGWGMPLYSALYSISILIYLKANNIKPSKYSWYWFVIMNTTALSFFLWSSTGMIFWQVLLLLFSAIYWTGSVFDITVKHKTSNYFIFDFINILFKIPFKNYDLYYKLKPINKEEITEENQAGKKAIQINTIYIVMGFLIALPAIAVILPLLIKADGNHGYFNVFINSIINLFKSINIIYFKDNLYTILFGLPVAIYILGLVAGSAHKRYTMGVDTKKIDKNIYTAKLLPQITAVTIMSIICLVYIVFILCQIPYLFSAFVGSRPEGFEVYSKYARSGFFELCKVASINLVIIFFVNLLKKNSGPQKQVIKWLVMLLSSLTILLIITAMSKMLLYIKIYGLSVLRVQTTAFMVYLLLIFGAVALLQLKDFSIVRFGVITGTAILCFLCIIGVNKLVLQYNLTKYMNHEINTFDTQAMWNSSEDGHIIMKNNYENLKNTSFIADIDSFIRENETIHNNEKPSRRDTVSVIRIRMLSSKK